MIDGKGLAGGDGYVAAGGSAAAQGTDRFTCRYTQDRSARVCECHDASIGQGCSAADGEVAGADRGATGAGISACQSEVYDIAETALLALLNWSVSLRKVKPKKICCKSATRRTPSFTLLPANPKPVLPAWSLYRLNNRKTKRLPVHLASTRCSAYRQARKWHNKHSF